MTLLQTTTNTPFHYIHDFFSIQTGLHIPADIIFDKNPTGIRHNEVFLGSHATVAFSDELLLHIDDFRSRS